MSFVKHFFHPRVFERDLAARGEIGIKVRDAQGAHGNGKIFGWLQINDLDAAMFGGREFFVALDKALQLELSFAVYAETFEFVSPEFAVQDVLRLCELEAHAAKNKKCFLGQIRAEPGKLPAKIERMIKLRKGEGEAKDCLLAGVSLKRGNQRGFEPIDGGCSETLGILGLKPAAGGAADFFAVVKSPGK